MTLLERLIIKAMKIDPAWTFGAIKQAIQDADLTAEQKQALKNSIESAILQSPQLKHELKPLGQDIGRWKELLGLTDSSTLGELAAAIEAVPDPGA